MSRILTMPSLMDVDVFAKGKIQVIESRVGEKSTIINKAFGSLTLPHGTSILALIRDGEIIIPHSSDRIHARDRVVITITTATTSLDCFH